MTQVKFVVPRRLADSINVPQVSKGEEPLYQIFTILRLAYRNNEKSKLEADRDQDLFT